MQRYRCNSCNYVFENLRREKSGFERALFEEYSKGKQTYNQLSVKHDLSLKTIQRHIDSYKFETKKTEPANAADGGKIVIGMDSFYFGRGYGIMLFRDVTYRKNLLWFEIKYETIDLYKEGIDQLKKQGFNIVGIVCDGKKGLFKAFPGIPVHMCQFHQILITRRYLTSKPILEPAIELRSIIKSLTKTDKETFIGAFNEWLKKWDAFLKEKSIDQDKGKWHYKHKKLRSAAHSIKINLPNLFVCYDYPQLKIPNTNNSIEGIISDIKTKTKLHQGLKKERRIKLINKLLQK